MPSDIYSLRLDDFRHDVIVLRRMERTIEKDIILERLFSEDTNGDLVKGSSDIDDSLYIAEKNINILNKNLIIKSYDNINKFY